MVVDTVRNTFYYNHNRIRYCITYAFHELLFTKLHILAHSQNKQFCKEYLMKDTGDIVTNT